MTASKMSEKHLTLKPVIILLVNYYAVLLSHIISWSFVGPHEMWGGNYLYWIGRHVKVVGACCAALSQHVSWRNMENEGITHRVARFWQLFAACAPQMQVRYVTAALTCSVTERWYTFLLMFLLYSCVRSITYV